MARLLAIAGLVIFSIYFIDEAAKNGGTVGGFLPVPSPMARGLAFELSWRKPSVLVSAMLTATGALMVDDGISIGTRYLAILTLPGPVIGFVYGLVVLALGIVKSVMTERSSGKI